MKRLSLTRMVFERRRENPGHVFPDDPCLVPGCSGRMYVYDSRVNKAGLRVRYMQCTECGHKPENNKWVE